MFAARCIGTTTRGVVVIYFGRLGGWLRPHQQVMLVADGNAIARIKQYDFGGVYQAGRSYSGPVVFVPDDCLLSEEAESLGIRGPCDLYGGVVPYPFVKTKSVTHPLVAADAVQPNGWSHLFAEKVLDVVLPGFTAFSARDARVAATRMLVRGTVRAKPPLGTGGRGQASITTLDELDVFLADLPARDIATYGLVLEEHLNCVTTRSVGHIMMGRLTMTYHGTQRRTTDNEGRSVYGGSDLVCVRGGWEQLDQLALMGEVRDAVNRARVYDCATREYPGFFASRRNYDVGQGIDTQRQWRSGVFEASWRVGGATAAEVLAMMAFQQEPALHVVEVSHIEEFGRRRAAPEGAIVHFQGDDLQDGPMIRYSIVRRLAYSARGFGG